MKKLLFLLALIPFVSSAQSTVNPDTVCYQTPGSTYSVVNDPNNTYLWSVVPPGVITSGQGTSAIVVDWSAFSPGLITNAVTVMAVNQFGCDTLVALNVFILNVVPSFTAQASCLDAGCVPLSGTPAGGVFTGPGVSGNQFCPSVAGVGNHTLTYTYTEAGCTFTTTGSGPFVVNPLPNISPISHN